ncbi:beta-lactamase domain-containing protein 2-like [Biomphalaria glabrata]|uniref:Beta-lactamase domain-containing protein 2-like n=1 Tax=Biomphalaria glabrata TaxID=6526 RepID=A0A9W2ZKY0_BIOGL|nr:beta-lactamase domain-containing protein 2-like [Biomphalaria glabrata]
MALRIPLPTGYVAPGFQKVLHVYSENFKNGQEKGSSFAAYYKGQLVINLWGGLADAQVKRPWKEDTYGFFYSTTKFFASVTIAHMVERGLLNYEDKISNFWPEFSQNGKENITLEMLLSHKAGLAALSDNFELRWMRDDPQKLTDMLAAQAPLWPPGSAHGYSPIVIGLYLNEIVKKVDKKGRQLSEYFNDEIAIPFGIDFHIGVPKHLQYRVARLEPTIISKDSMAEMMGSFQGDISLFQLAFSQPKDWNSSRKLNDPDFMSLPCSASHGAGTAAAVAKLAGILANGGSHDGNILLQQGSIELLQQPLAHGIDLTTGVMEILGRGTMLLPVVEGSKCWFMTGHSGKGDQYCAVDPVYKVGWAYITNFTDDFIAFNSKHKWSPLIQSLFECVHDLEGVVLERRILASYSDIEREKLESWLLNRSKL